MFFSTPYANLDDFMCPTRFRSFSLNNMQQPVVKEQNSYSSGMEKGINKEGTMTFGSEGMESFRHISDPGLSETMVSDTAQKVEI